MPVFINGVEQMIQEEREIFSKIRSETKKSYGLAVASLIIAILSIIISAILFFIKS